MFVKILCFVLVSAVFVQALRIPRDVEKEENDVEEEDTESEYTDEEEEEEEEEVEEEKKVVEEKVVKNSKPPVAKKSEPESSVGVDLTKMVVGRVAQEAGERYGEFIYSEPTTTRRRTKQTSKRRTKTTKKAKRPAKRPTHRRG